MLHLRCLTGFWIRLCIVCENQFDYWKQWFHAKSILHESNLCLKYDCCDSFSTYCCIKLLQYDCKKKFYSAILYLYQELCVLFLPLVFTTLILWTVIFRNTVIFLIKKICSLIEIVNTQTFYKYSSRRFEIESLFFEDGIYHNFPKCILVA